MKKEALRLPVYLLSILVLSSCGYRIEKEPTKSLATSPSGLNGYAEIQALVFQPKCATCHAWGNNDKYDLVFQRKDEIQSRVSSGNMPAANSPTGPLTAAEKEMLLNWLARGAPREGSAIPPITQPENPPVPPPVESCTINPNNPSDSCIGFAEIKSKVLQPKCATCHNFPETYAKTFAKVSLIQDRVSQGFMPPSRALPLSDFEKTMLLSWIARGAPETGNKGGNPNNPVPPTPPPPCDCFRHGDDCNNNKIANRHGDDCLQ